MGAVPEWAEGEKYCLWFLRTTYVGHVLFANGNAVWVDENPATLSEAIRPAIWIRSGKRVPWIPSMNSAGFGN